MCFNTNSTVGFIVLSSTSTRSYSSSSKYHALSGGGGASDVLPFPAESATVNGGAVCCPLFIVVVWSGGSMILSADEYIAEQGQYRDVILMEIVFL